MVLLKWRFIPVVYVIQLKFTHFVFFLLHSEYLQSTAIECWCQHRSEVSLSLQCTEKRYIIAGHLLVTPPDYIQHLVHVRSWVSGMVRQRTFNLKNKIKNGRFCQSSQACYEAVCLYYGINEHLSTQTKSNS
jgi:hypothetical protein